MRNYKISTWRLINAPATIGTSFNGAVMMPLFPIFFLSLLAKVPELNIIVVLMVTCEILRIKFNLLTIGDLFKYVYFKHIVGHKWHGFNRLAYSSLTSVLFALVLVIPMSADAAFTVIRPEDQKIIPNTVQPQQPINSPAGGEFIDNRKTIRGGGQSIDLETLLTQQLVPPTFSVQFKSVEIASMNINWRSSSWTLDQILGNIALRYGIMFETMEGSSVVSVDWYDKSKCEKDDKKLFKRLCGSTEGFF